FQAEPGVRRAIDVFLSSLAQVRGPKSAAVIFSGADNDGAAGMAQIKDAGGLTIAQSPVEASHALMPEASIATGKIDHVLPVAEMPRKLLEHFPGRRQSLAEVHSLEELALIAQQDEAALRAVLATVRENTGLDFTPYRRQGLLRQLSR